MAITSRYLSEKFGINLAKVKRWSRNFLPPNPNASLQCGYTREYTDNEAFTLHLGGYLVSVYKFSVHEAKTIIEDINPFLFQRGLYPETPNRKPSEFEKKISSYEIHIMRTNLPGRFWYEWKGRIREMTVKRDYESVPDDTSVIEERYAEGAIQIPRFKTQVHIDRSYIRILRISHILYLFILAIKGKTGLQNWLLKQN